MNHRYLNSIMHTKSAKLLAEFRSRIVEMVPQLNWTQQGFGMYRAYLGENQIFRLNIWHPSLRNPDLEKTESDIHSHPWDFFSKIIYGKIINIRYVASKPTDYLLNHENLYHRKLIQPGLSCTDLNIDPEVYFLNPCRTEVLTHGTSYYQIKTEIHKTIMDGLTITLNLRKRGDKDEALTFWRQGTEWTNCKPSVIDSHEVSNLLLLMNP